MSAKQPVTKTTIATIAGLVFVGISVIVLTVMVLAPDRGPMIAECENRGGTFVKTVYASFCVKSGDIIIVWTDGRKFDGP